VARDTGFGLGLWSELSWISLAPQRLTLGKAPRGQAAALPEMPIGKTREIADFSVERTAEKLQNYGIMSLPY